MAELGREDRVIQDRGDGTQSQRVVQHGPSLLQGDPSTVKYLVANEDYLKRFARVLAGQMQVPTDTGQMQWIEAGKPLLNLAGRNWLLSQLSSALDKSITLSNFPEGRLKQILETEYESIAIHLALHLTEYQLEEEDCENLMVYVRRGVESAYRRSVGDKGAKHVYGSVDESNSFNQQKPNDKWFGVIPKIY